MKQAFSLVELSIVLVILGLLTGGILAGQSLIRASELRSVTTQASQYMTAGQAFRDKYFALPGDMTNATSFWTAAHTTPATCVTTAGTGTQTCNGDGNGLIGFAAGSNELYRAWQHLANAGLIEGTYSGITQGSTTYSTTAANAPRGKLGNSLWHVYGWGESAGAAGDMFAGNYGNAFEFGGVVANSDPATPIMKPEEMWNLDTKMDDGKPSTGSIVTRQYGACATATGVSDANATYTLTSTANSCVPIFIRVF